MQFKIFKDAIAKQFSLMAQYNMLRTDVDKDVLWDTYLSSFPEGTNPIYKERAEYDCTACKQFIRTVGDTVAIIDGKLVSIWDIALGDDTYQVVANAMSALVKSKPIENIFLHSEKVAGIDKNFSQLTSGMQTWEHFFVHIPSGARGTRCFYKASKDIGPALSEARAQHDVLKRSLEEITNDSIDTVLELIAQNALYRGVEKKNLVEALQHMKADYDRVDNADRDLYVWAQLDGPYKFACKVRNDVIGTLLVDLSDGVDLERAVASFEAKVAPTNYQRPTSLVTPKMVENAKQTIEGLGLTSALDRRYATLTDITVNNVLFVDRTTRSIMEGSVFDDLATSAPVNTKKLDNVQEVTIEKFIEDILPKVDSIEIMLEDAHAGNLVSLIAPADPTAGQLFKWSNNFSWSYSGQLADSIKERVKKAGGNVTGDLCCRLSWDNTDDLDLHMIEPDGYHIYYSNRRQRSACGGILDLDANGCDGNRTDPSENIYYQNEFSMKEGVYTLYVHQYTKRNQKDFGFEVEIDFKGSVTRYAYPKVMNTNDKVIVAKFQYSKANGIVFLESLPSAQSGKEIWGLKTQTFHKVNVMLLSPNYWDGDGVGNKHYFFMLDGCKNDSQPRGIFNEFLSGALAPHGKVFEMVGAKLTIPESAEQLSGIGFSSTQRNKILCKVSGSFSRIIKITF